MRRFFPILLALAPVLAGCPPEILPLRTQSSVERSYTLGATAVVAPGAAMIVVRRLTAAPIYEVAFDYTPPQHDMFSGGLDYPPLRKGSRFIQSATRADGAIGLSRPGYGVTRSASLADRKTYMPVTIWISRDGVVDASMEGRRWTVDMLFLPTKGPNGLVEAMRSEIVLDSIDGALISATLREFEGGAAAPAVERPLRFDTSVDRRIYAMGLTMEILDVSSSAVEYRVVEESVEN